MNIYGHDGVSAKASYDRIIKHTTNTTNSTTILLADVMMLMSYLQMKMSLVL